MMGTVRMLALMLSSSLPLCAFAQSATPLSVAPPMLDTRLGISMLRLWQGDAPDARGTAPKDVPALTVMRPAHPNGTAIIIAPGGAYGGLAMNLEGREPGDRMAALGITVFILQYRLKPDYSYPAPLEDARRAIQLVRFLAHEYGYSPDRIGMMGFSAGGHLAAMAATAPIEGDPASADPVARFSSNLAFAVLVYPWLNAMQPPVTGGKGPMINFCSSRPPLPQSVCEHLAGPYTPSLRVTANTPPMFIVHTTDDQTVPVQASVEFYSALQAAGRDAELHIFAHGKHGSGTGGSDAALSNWPRLLTEWLRARGWLDPQTSTK